MRDGDSFIPERCSKANKKYFISYDQKQELKDIIYINAGSWYGYAMLKFLPINWFKRMDPKDFDSNKYGSNNSEGYVFVVDLEDTLIYEN